MATFTVKQVRKAAEDRYDGGILPQDIALDELERLSTLGVYYEQVLRAPGGTTIRRAADGRWSVNDGPLRKHLKDALEKAGIHYE